MTNSIIALDTTKSTWTDTSDDMQYARKQHACIVARYWAPQILPQICTVIAYICIGKVA